MAIPESMEPMLKGMATGFKEQGLDPVTELLKIYPYLKDDMGTLTTIAYSAPSKYEPTSTYVNTYTPNTTTVKSDTYGGNVDARVKTGGPTGTSTKESLAAAAKQKVINQQNATKLASLSKVLNTLNTFTDPVTGNVYEKDSDGNITVTKKTQGGTAVTVYDSSGNPIGDTDNMVPDGIRTAPVSTPSGPLYVPDSALTTAKDIINKERTSTDPNKAGAFRAASPSGTGTGMDSITTEVNPVEQQIIDEANNLTATPEQQQQNLDAQIKTETNALNANTTIVDPNAPPPKIAEVTPPPKPTDQPVTTYQRMNLSALVNATMIVKGQTGGNSTSIQDAIAANLGLVKHENGIWSMATTASNNAVTQLDDKTQLAIDSLASKIQELGNAVQMDDAAQLDTILQKLRSVGSIDESGKVVSYADVASLITNFSSDKVDANGNPMLGTNSRELLLNIATINKTMETALRDFGELNSQFGQKADEGWLLNKIKTGEQSATAYASGISGGSPLQSIAQEKFMRDLEVAKIGLVDNEGDGIADELKSYGMVDKNSMDPVADFKAKITSLGTGDANGPFSVDSYFTKDENGNDQFISQWYDANKKQKDFWGADLNAGPAVGSQAWTMLEKTDLTIDQLGNKFTTDWNTLNPEGGLAIRGIKTDYNAAMQQINAQQPSWIDGLASFGNMVAGFISPVKGIMDMASWLYRRT